MKKLFSITFVTAVLLMAFNCNDQKSTQMTKAKIIFSGLVAADGCGWLLEVDGEEYSPVNLDKAFEQEDLNVDVELEYLESGFQCGMNPNFKIPQVKIISIKYLTE